MDIVCDVCRHYRYTLAEAKKLTPRQAYHMIMAHNRERSKEFETLAVMLGAKIEKKPDPIQLEADNVDTSEIDKLSVLHMERLKGRAKDAGKN